MAEDVVLLDARRLAAVLDRLVPPVDDLPGAGGLGLAPRVMEVAGSVSRFGEALSSVAAGLTAELDKRDFAALDAAQQTAILRAVEQAHPAAFTAFVKLTYLVYYGDDRVQERIGWQTGGVQPHGFELPPFEESLLDTTRNRAPFWRKA